MSSPSDSFVHLHVHTEYSMLDGAAKLPEVTAAAAAAGMPALAMTDHGNVFGAYDFYKQATKAGVKPIIGMEGYYTPGSRFDRAPFDFGDKLLDEEGDGGNNRGKAAYTHMTLLARTTEGMHNLFRISSLASLEGQYRKPRFDRDLLERYGKGLIATTGCPSGEVNMWLRAGKEDRARQAAADFQDIFGKENFYAEVMDHGLSIEKKTKPALLAIAKDLGIPLLGTNDLHYTHKEDAQAHDALLCIQTGSRLNETNRFRFNGDGYYLKSSAEMRALFADMPEACDNTLLVAEQCEVTFTEGADLMPRFPLPEGEDETSWFIKEVERGLHKRWPGGIPDHVRKQADYEVGIIMPDGLPGVLPRGRRLHQLGQGQRHPGRPGPWLGRRLAGRLRDGHHRPRPAGPRPDLRAVPQPRARLHARRRHRLRRPPPRRGHPVRVGEVRRGAGQPDRHLRHDQGQGRDQGRRPGARPPLLGRRRADQADAAGRHGQGHPAVGHLRPEPRALQGGRGVPGPLRVRPGRGRGRRPGPQARGPEAAVGRARRRRDHRPATR